MIEPNKQIEWFNDNRPELMNYIKNEVLPSTSKVKLIHAAVKSGKRGMVEIISLFEKLPQHIYLTALHRIADKSQREEISSYGIKVFSVNNKDKKNNCIKYIDDLLSEKKIIKIHLDELDFGCGHKQLLNHIWTKYKNNSNVFFILYSATIEVAKKEFLVENNINNFYECKRFVPPVTYYGISNYLENDKFFQAEPFINYDENKDELVVSEQGDKLIKQLIDNTKNINNKKHIGILRLAGNFKYELNGTKTLVSQFEKMKNNKDYFQEKYNIRFKFVGTNDNFVEWDNDNYWEELSPNLSFIIVINQVSGRSTEWKCHPYICWYHTLRTDITPIGTIVQDQERPVYYTTIYKDDINIEIYGDKECALYSAGKTELKEFLLKTSRKLHARLNTKIKQIHIDVDTYYYDTWQDIPTEYRKGKNVSTHINENNILKQTMYINEKNNNGVITRKEYRITNWDKYSHLEGFYMTNVRSSRTNFIKGNPKQTPIWFKENIILEIKEGINEKSKIRINLIYDNNEIDPTNYKFIVRKFKNSTETNFSNVTMFNS